MRSASASAAERSTAVLLVARRAEASRLTSQTLSDGTGQGLASAYRMTMGVNCGTLAYVEAQDVVGGRYRLERPLGHGGMSVVWRAHDQVLGRAVAVKVLAGRYVQDQVFRNAIQREAKAVARLSHPHVASVHDYGESVDSDGESVPFVVMELLAGRSLAERIAASSMTPRMALRVSAQVAAALAAAHANGVVHRDVKPGNIMLTAAGAKVFDFGISALVGTSNTADQKGRIFGTLNYMAPERLVDGSVVAASDVYALGLLLCRLLTNQLPPWAGDPVAFLAKPSGAAIEPLPEIDGVPADVNELYLRCVARDPAQRPSAREAAVVLADAAGMRAPLGQSSTDIEDDSTNLTHDVGKFPTTVGTVRGSGRRWRRAAIGTSVLLAGAALAAGLAARLADIASAVGSAAAGGSGPGAMAETPGTHPTPGVPTIDPSANPSGGANLSGSSRPVAATIVAGAPGVTESADLPSAPSSTVESPTQAPLVPTTYNSAGGSIVVTCTNGKAELLSWTPAAGYTVKRHVKGPAARVAVSFKSDTATVGMIVTCQNNQPQLVIKDSDV